MSHATVMVVGDDIEGQLAPYDENLQVEPYRDYAEDPWFTRLAKEEADIDPTDLAALANYANTRWAGDGEGEWGVDEKGLYQISTYNPKSKWDWWVIGGRWAGRLLLRSGLVGRPNIRVNEFSPEVAKQEMDYFRKAGVLDGRHADQARKGDIDLEGMRVAAQAKAEAEWDQWAAWVDGTPEAVEWAAFIGRRDAGEAIDPLRDEFHAQPRVRRMSEHPDWRWDAAILLSGFQRGRDVYALRARVSAVPCFATLIEGEWIEPGRLAWFGIDTAEDSERVHYWEAMNGRIDALPDNALITVVDYHI